jgi:hypothetical protein
MNLMRLFFAGKRIAGKRRRNHGRVSFVNFLEGITDESRGEIFRLLLSRAKKR